jgi:hypothetical protein
MDTNTIYCFWTGDNPMNNKRKSCLQHSIETSKCNIILITKNELDMYILDEHPLHPAYQYLSETHKSDYLRTYFANFYGGGYIDIKRTLGSWVESFEELKTSDKWICGYRMQGDGHVNYEPSKPFWPLLVGVNAYICKPQTPLTQEWYKDMIAVLDSKLETLKKNPAKYTNDSTWSNSGYPMGWTEMLGDIFFRVSCKYRDQILYTLPKLILDLNDYR